MPSKSQTFRLPPDLAEAITLRAKALGFRTVTDYLKSVARYDLLIQGDHVISKPWSDLPVAQQDKIDARLLQLTKAGKGERGQYLEKVLRKFKGNLDKLTDEMTQE